jgi:hypothetical protein
VAGLTRKWDSHNSGKSHSAHHAHCSPFLKLLKRIISRSGSSRSLWRRPQSLKPRPTKAASERNTVDRVSLSRGVYLEHKMIRLHTLSGGVSKVVAGTL